VLSFSRKLKDDFIRLNQDSPPVQLDPQLVFQDVVSSLELQSGVQVSIEVREHTSDVFAVRDQVVDILHNLVVNAVQAMAGRPHKCLTLRARNDGIMVAFEVSDTGAGIQPAHQKRIFDLNHSTKKSTGFGLWSARYKARKNSGHLKLEDSTVGQGSTFVLLLPRASRG
jgi:signal transduction histidine kinase